MDVVCFENDLINVSFATSGKDRNVSYFIKCCSHCWQVEPKVLDDISEFDVSSKQKKIDQNMCQSIALNMNSDRDLHYLHDLFKQYRGGSGLSDVRFYYCNESSDLNDVAKRFTKGSVLVVIHSAFEVFGILEFIGEKKNEEFYQRVAVDVAGYVEQAIKNKQLALQETDGLREKGNASNCIISVGVPDEVFSYCQNARIVFSCFEDCFEESIRYNASLLLIVQDANTDFEEVIDKVLQIRDSFALEKTRVIFFCDQLLSSYLNTLPVLSDFIVLNKAILRLPEFRVHISECIFTDIRLAPKSASCLCKAICRIDFDFPKDIDELCEASNLSLPYIKKQFKQFVGISIETYQKLIRCYNARILLDDNKSVEKVFMLTGYKDRQTFCDDFSSFFGYLPSDYKKQKKRTIRRSPVNFPITK